jgi:hypothetical protein
MRYTVWGHPVEITYTTTILSKVREKSKGTGRRDQTFFDWHASDMCYVFICGIMGLSTCCYCAAHEMQN